MKTDDGYGEGMRTRGSVSRRLRICLLLPKLAIGGAEFQTLHLLRNLDTSRFNLFLCCMTRGDREMEEEAERYAESVFFLGFRWRFFPIVFVKLVRYLRWGRFDVLHCHLPLADSIGRLAGWIAGIPVLMTTEHGKNLWKGFPYLLLERFLRGITDVRICVSHDIMDIRKKREGTPDEKLEYIPNAVDPEECKTASTGRAAVMSSFGWGVADQLVISVGRLVPAKNYSLLVESVMLLCDRYPTIRCLIVGEGSCRPEIERNIDELNLGGHLILAGMRRDIPDLLAAADVFVLSSVREGLPLSLLEAMAAGKAVVCTDVGGIPDAVADGKNGLLVSSGDAGALAGAIGRLLDDADLRNRFGHAAHQEVERKFSVRIMARKTGEIYKRLYDLKSE